MDIFEMLEQSGIMTLVGMGIVFGFLVVLVLAIGLMSKVVGRFMENSAPVAATANNELITAVISASVNEYRKADK